MNYSNIGTIIKSKDIPNYLVIFYKLNWYPRTYNYISLRINFILHFGITQIQCIWSIRIVS
jgi:hypothetical protein